MSGADQYPNAAEVREWALSKRAGAGLANTGRLPRFVILAWDKAHPDRPYVASQAWHGTEEGYARKGCDCERCLEVGRRVRRERARLNADERNDELSDLLAADTQ